MHVKNLRSVYFVKVKMVRSRRRLYSASPITSPKDVVEVALRLLKGLDREVLVVFGLDGLNHITVANFVSIGGVDFTAVHPREVLKPVILSNSTSFVLAHNHPSGCPEPSRADIGLTGRMVHAARTMGIKLHDHVIVVDDGSHVSLGQRGHLKTQTD